MMSMLGVWPLYWCLFWGRNSCSVCRLSFQFLSSASALKLHLQTTMNLIPLINWPCTEDNDMYLILLLE